jgi:hypothetical protein
MLTVWVQYDWLLAELQLPMKLDQQHLLPLQSQALRVLG